MSNDETRLRERLAALTEERRGYVARGLKDRVAAPTEATPPKRSTRRTTT